MIIPQLSYINWILVYVLDATTTTHVSQQKWIVINPFNRLWVVDSNIAFSFVLYIADIRSYPNTRERSRHFWICLAAWHRKFPIGIDKNHRFRFRKLVNDVNKFIIVFDCVCVYRFQAIFVMYKMTMCRWHQLSPTRKKKNDRKRSIFLLDCNNKTIVTPDYKSWTRVFVYIHT